MPSTYEPIATTTLGSAAATITFSSIPATYTDLRLILVTRGATGTGNRFDLQLNFNSDTGANYSRTFLNGNGTTVTSTRGTSVTYLYLGAIAGPSLVAGTFSLNTVDIFSYAGSTNKTVLATASNDYGTDSDSLVQSMVGLWRSTSAINRIDLVTNTSFITGTTATLYGIKNA